jgi:hypothetical protein
MVLNRKHAFICSICGLELDEKPWGDDLLSPTFDICPCCGVEFGYEDCQLNAIRAYRKNWLQNGSPWCEPKEKPPQWSLEIQLKNVPDEFE